eukprot:Colp12_sorted_trinity150504_noHs@27425
MAARCPTQCAVCLSPEPEVTLKRCTGCRTVAYCSVEHQKSQWPKHKKFCKLLASVLQTPRPSISPGDEAAWQAFKKQQISMFEMLALMEGFDRTQVEQLSLWIQFQRVCQYCYTSQGLYECEKCHMVSFCCKEHESRMAEEHKAACPVFMSIPYAQKMVTESEDKCPPIWIPSAIQKEYTPLPAEGWFEYLKLREAPEFGLALLHITNYLSYPTTIISAIEKLMPHLTYKNESSITIHLVGAELCPEQEGWTKYEEVLHYLPTVRSVHVAFVGPNVTPSTHLQLVPREEILCPTCMSDARDISFSFYQGPYEEYVQHAVYRPADLAVAFNCGVHEYWDENTGKPKQQDTWGPGLAAVLGQGTPLVLTSYNEQEAALDYKRLKSLGAETLLLPAKNAYRSLLPSMEVDKFNAFYQQNQYWCAVKGIKK